MQLFKRNPLTITFTVLLLGAIACNAPIPNAEEPTAITEQGVTPIPADPGIESDPANTPNQSPTEIPAAPTADPLPEGWATYHDPQMGISFYQPAEWEVKTFEGVKIELWQTEGYTWAEITTITTESADAWSIPYTEGMAAEAIINLLIDAMRQDGTFDAPHHVLTPDGRTAWATQGHNDIFDDKLFIGVIGYQDYALIMLGHDTPDEQDIWVSDLLPLYEAVFGSISNQ